MASIGGTGELQDGLQRPVDLVRQGLPYDNIEALLVNLDISIEELCRIIPVSRRTLARLKGTRLDAHLSDHVYIAERVFQRAEEVMESADNARLWLKTPNYAFNYARPLDYLSSLTGSMEVLDELGRIQHGVFI